MSSSVKDMRFQAVIYKVGVNRCVDIPQRISQALGSEKHIPVVGSVAGEQLRSTLVPRGGGLHRLFIHSRIWRKLGIDCGATVNITLIRDRRAGHVPLPPEIAAGFPRGSKKLAAFNSQTAAVRRRFVTWVMEAKTSRTRKQRIQRFIEMKIKPLLKGHL